MRNWISTLRWQSADCLVAIGEISAVGQDCEHYEWTRIYAVHFCDGLLGSVRQFDDDEDGAYAYAATLDAPQPTRLPLDNRACRTQRETLYALEAGNVSAAAACYADGFTYEDRRRLDGEPVDGHEQLRADLERICARYGHFHMRPLAVRGERSSLSRSRWSDGSGSEAITLHVIEIDGEGRIAYEARFDHDQFLAAYRELERRYYSGEGSEFALHGLHTLRFVESINRLDVTAAKECCIPEFVWLAPPSTFATDARSLDDMFEWFTSRAQQVGSVQNWLSVVCWLSPTRFVGRGEAAAFDDDGEEFVWTRIYVDEFRDGRMAQVQQFDDEGSAFAHAESIAAPSDRRLALTNRASEFARALTSSMQTRDAAACMGLFTVGIVYDDHRSLAGGPVEGRTQLGAALERVFTQFCRFELDLLAVRGERLALLVSRWSDDAGNETASHYVFGLGDDDLFDYMGRFDEDDFDGAHRELDRRYYAGEGTAYARSGSTLTQIMELMNGNQLDVLFERFITPGLRIENRSRSAFPDRSATELQASVADLNQMMTSVRAWNSAIHWASPTCASIRQERQAEGPDGEPYAWSRILVCEFRDDVLVALCDFDPDDEQRALAYATERAGSSVGQ